MIRLIIFDVDGTLAVKYTLNLLPGVAEFFELALDEDCAPGLRLAIATNQGGVGMRYWMETGNFGRPKRYPTLSQIERRMAGLMKKLGSEHIPVYVSFRYQDKEGQWAPVPPGEEANPRWSATWRKPEPGMLLQAMLDAGVSAEETLFVGDSPDDHGAARAAGCLFIGAEAFFSRDWSNCETLVNLLDSRQ